MTIKDLAQYQIIKKEIIQLEEKIQELEATIIGSSKVSNSPKSNKHNSSSPTERIACKLVKLKNDLEKKQENLIDELNNIELFLTTVDNSEIRVIIRKRFIDGKEWEIIGEDLNEDRTTSYKKLKNYLKDLKLKNEKK